MRWVRALYPRPDPAERVRSGTGGGGRQRLSGRRQGDPNDSSALRANHHPRVPRNTPFTSPTPFHTNNPPGQPHTARPAQPLVGGAAGSPSPNPPLTPEPRYLSHLLLSPGAESSALSQAAAAASPAPSLAPSPTVCPAGRLPLVLRPATRGRALPPTAAA